MANKKDGSKKNRKIRKRVRKTSAAILMILALVVALIPEQITVAAPGDVWPDTVTKIEYDETLTLDPGSSDYTHGAEVEYYAYEIVDLGDGSYRMLWIYKAWVKDLNGTSIGVISDFNESYTPVDNTLTIPSNIITEFVQFEDTDVDAYIAGLDATGWDELNTYFGTEVDSDTGDFIDPITSSTISADQKMRYYLKSIDCEGFEARIVITDIVGGVNVEKYVPYSGTTGYKSVTELNVAAIGDEAFYDSSTGTGKANHITNLNLEIQNNIVAIGNDAFRGASSMTGITIGAGVKDIGNRAFQACTNLSSLIFSDGLTSVGLEAFRGCNSLVEVILPNTLNEVQAGAFAYCKTLSIVDMSRSTQSDLTIGNFAFYDCPNITEIEFGAFTTNIGDGAFSVTSSAPLVENGWTEMAFPDYIETLGAHLFDGRYTLESVTMPKSYGATLSEPPTDVLDEGTFMGCTSLETVIFPEACKYASFPTEIFNHADEDFYVQGPASSVGGENGYSYPRIAAHAANVPYMYVEDDITYYEVKIGLEFFRINESNELISFETETTDPTFDLNIPATIGSYAVASIADGCFDDVKDMIATITIPDDSISTLEAGVFSNCDELTTVSIGNSVTAIGDSAFEDCRNLTYISFETPANGYDSLTIGSNAFTTNSAELTLQGDIDEEYAPFTWAMGADNYLNENGKRVAYRSNAPTNLTVMYDNSTDLITLIDYPVYNNVDEDNANLMDELKEYYLDLYPAGEYPTENQAIQDYSFSIFDKFELIYEDEVFSDNPWEKLSLDEQAIYDSIIHVNVPEGIESIDAYTFFTDTENSENWGYVDLARRSIYTESTDTVHGGLFSGNFDDYSAIDSREELEIGNDRIQSITLNDTISIPAYAFESCEALETVTLGGALSEMGELPFAGCTSLTSISGNDNFASENGIVYQSNADSSYTIVQALPNRGNTVGSKTVSPDTDTLLESVSSIADSAFRDCTYINKVDFSDSESLTTIPPYCFNGCTSLYNGVELPDTVSTISENAFTDTTEALSVTIPNRVVSIRDTAFDHNQGLIKCYEDSTAYTYASYYNIETEIIEEIYEVSFLDYDGSLIGEIQDVETGKDADLPDDPTRDGYTFTGWSASHKDIMENTIIIAQYETTSSSGDGTTTPTPTSTDGTTTTDGTQYAVTVTSGSGSGSYTAGTVVNITANASASGLVFDKWSSSSNGTYFASSTSVTTSFVMPSNEVAISASYKEAGADTDDGDDDDGDASDGEDGSAGDGSDTTGTVITISKPGISDTDKATVSVSGSTDNFVIKVSDSSSAQELVEAALIASTETFDTIKYFPMDISLYDETGTVKVTDTTGLEVTITMPIPDELQEYGGNCKAAAVVDGDLEILPVKFLTIDNVACIQFTATHFSPYTIYVDTGNLEAGGVVDSNPKTGDGIHPKWFLVLGLSSAAIVLFLKKDKEEKVSLA